MKGRKPEFGAYGTGEGAGSRVIPSHVGTVRSLDPPAGLSERALEHWHTLVPDLAATGVYRPSDALLLRQFVEALARADEASERLAVLDPESLEAKRVRGGCPDRC